MTFLLVNFAVKNAMFNLNENNRFVMAQHPSDMRIGVNGMCGQVRAVGLDPTNGDVSIFVGSSRKIMKLLHWERGGYDIVGIEPLRWLTDVLDSLRDDTPPDQVRQMLPYYYKKSQG